MVFRNPITQHNIWLLLPFPVNQKAKGNENNCIKKKSNIGKQY